MKTLCIIPVRGGSKGIPRKNLAELFEGMTLLEWTIRQAQVVYAGDELIVSTDDEAMAAAAGKCGTRVDMRPPELAQDASTTASVVEYLLEKLDPEASIYDTIAILQVTSPLRQSEDIAQSRRMMEEGNYDSIVSAFIETEAHPAKMYVMCDGFAEPVLPKYEASRRQDLPPIYRRNGAIFVVRRTHFLQTGQLWGGRTGLVEMPRERSVDIDAPGDLDRTRSFLAEPAAR